MKIALCLGGADCLLADMMAAPTADVIVACNDVPTIIQGVDHWVTLHSEHYPRWLDKRRPRGWHDPQLWAQRTDYRAVGVTLRETPWAFPGQPDVGSSGIFCAKVALVDLGCDMAILCGIPMTATPHIYGGEPWAGADRYYERLDMIPPEYRTRIRSMSGRTAEFFGRP